MRYLEGEEKRIADHIYAEAIAQGDKAACAKSKRGVIFAKGAKIIGRGNNGPPPGYLCNPDSCRQRCADYAVHAEMRAIFDVMHSGHDIRGARGYHVKVVDGKGVSSSTPSCLNCSKHMKDAGVAEFVLQDEKGYALYSMEEFHDETLKNCVSEEFLHAIKKD
jgi:deoxycytidylate deaminase